MSGNNIGRLIAINISEKRGTKKHGVDSVRLIENWGLENDAHAGNWIRQVSLLPLEKIESFNEKGAGVKYGEFGENLVVSGFDLKRLSVGSRIIIGDSVLRITQIGKECHSHCEIFERMGECIMPYEGVFAEVLLGGEIRAGDKVTVVPANRLKSINRMILCGGGHVSSAVLGMARTLGFETVVIEDREEFSEKLKNEGADKVICKDFSTALKELPETEKDYYVVLTRGHYFDVDALKEILKKDFLYVGMMGSRKRAAMVKEELKACGYDEKAVEGLHSPIGLSINAETPEEIAVSIMAEIISVKNEGEQKGNIEKVVAEYIEDANHEPAVLCQIIEKHGSAPRSVGTTMLVKKNEIISTIGGGRAEAEIINLARDMLDGKGNRVELGAFTMNNAEAYDDGLLCGGSIRVLFERI